MTKFLLTLLLTISSFYSIGQDTVNLTASFYHDKYVGRKTTSGEVYSQKKLTAASNTYSLGTKLLITNRTTGECVEVVVNDRMAAYITKRIDLSKYAFKRLAPLARGLQKVSVTQIL